ncbi:hypothetical protein DH2020_048356 [Rehmannia glutinosa]|uniref:Leucine zipper homeobox-associated domain-containing protein n=1 Tax=Rehmannia glutinosa TaxID=99300 RepID=A0ABR0U6F9_REHGL
MLYPRRRLISDAREISQQRTFSIDLLYLIIRKIGRWCDRVVLWSSDSGTLASHSSSESETDGVGTLMASTTLTRCVCEREITNLFILNRGCSSATNRLITSKDHASGQINVGHLDERGVYSGGFSTFALCGFIRAQSRVEDCALVSSTYIYDSIKASYDKLKADYDNLYAENESLKNEVYDFLNQCGLSENYPSVVNVGGLFTFNSAIRRSDVPAIVAATEDVNSDTTIFKNTKINFILQDTNCSGFLRTVKDFGIDAMSRHYIV